MCTEWRRISGAVHHLISAHVKNMVAMGNAEASLTQSAVVVAATCDRVLAHVCRTRYSRG